MKTVLSGSGRLTSSRAERGRFRQKTQALGSVALAGLLASIVGVGCRKPQPDAAGASLASSAAAVSSAGIGQAAGLEQAWARAAEGDEEDRMDLAAREGALGLLEAARDPARRRTALVSMGKARGFAQLPYLANVARASADDEARLALDAAIELGNRVRTSEDLEDTDELREGCEGLRALCMDANAPKVRRVAALRAYRILPCGAADGGGLPVDLDAK